MSAKDYYRNQIAIKRKEILELKSDKVRLSERKKYKLEQLSKSIKFASSASSKLSYKKQKIDATESFKRESENINKRIANVNLQIKNFQLSMKNVK